jgi:hypothetical protein
LDLRISSDILVLSVWISLAKLDGTLILVDGFLLGFHLFVLFCKRALIVIENGVVLLLRDGHIETHLSALGHQ